MRKLLTKLMPLKIDQEVLLLVTNVTTLLYLERNFNSISLRPLIRTQLLKFNISLRSWKNQISSWGNARSPSRIRLTWIRSCKKSFWNATLSWRQWTPKCVRWRRLCRNMSSARECKESNGTKRGNRQWRRSSRCRSKWLLRIRRLHSSRNNAPICSLWLVKTTTSNVQ